MSSKYSVFVIIAHIFLNCNLFFVKFLDIRARQSPSDRRYRGTARTRGLPAPRGYSSRPASGRSAPARNPGHFPDHPDPARGRHHHPPGRTERQRRPQDRGFCVRAGDRLLRDAGHRC